jgi:hypothetical protein
MPLNGAINKRFGVYQSVCCGAEIVITEGTRFPDCPNHPHLSTKWRSSVEEPIRHAKDLPSAKKKANDPAA